MSANCSLVSTNFTSQFPFCSTPLCSTLSSLRQLEEDTKKLRFDKGQEVVQLESKIFPLRTRVIELEDQTEETKAKMAKLEERATNQEVQIGRVESELAKKTEAEIIEDAADAYGWGFEDALAQVACVHPELDLTPCTVVMQVVDGQLMLRAHPS